MRSGGDGGSFPPFPLSPSPLLPYSMKVAILSDIHGNLPALQAVTADIEQWNADEVIVNGDIVNRGPKPLECWSWVQAQRRDVGWHITRGNHEDYVIKHAHPVPDADHVGIRAEINKSSLWTYQQLNGSVADLAALPDVVRLFGENGRFSQNNNELRATHASMNSNQDCIWPVQHTNCPTSNDEAVRQQIGASPPALFVTSHIHLAHKRQIDDTTVINTGSAGNHCYGEKRATYAQAVFQNGKWDADIVRVPYDMAQTERDYHDSGFLEETGAGAGGRLLFYEWKTAVPILTKWRKFYEVEVLAGRMELETAVSQFLAEQGMM